MEAMGVGECHEAVIVQRMAMVSTRWWSSEQGKKWIGLTYTLELMSKT